MENDGFTPLKKVTESDFRFKASHLWHPASKSVKKRLFYTDIAEIVRWGPNYKKEPHGPSPSLKIRYFCCFVFLGLLGPWKDFFRPRDPTPPFMKLRTPGPYQSCKTYEAVPKLKRADILLSQSKILDPKQFTLLFPPSPLKIFGLSCFFPFSPPILFYFVGGVLG